MLPNVTLLSPFCRPNEFSQETWCPITDLIRIDVDRSSRLPYLETLSIHTPMTHSHFGSDLPGASHSCLGCSTFLTFLPLGPAQVSLGYLFPHNHPFAHRRTDRFSAARFWKATIDESILQPLRNSVYPVCFSPGSEYVC